MKTKLSLLFLVLTFLVKGQSEYYGYYSNQRNNQRNNQRTTWDLIFVQGDTSLITTFNNVDRKNFGFYIGVKYQGLLSGSILYTPFNSINRLGITKGFLSDGIRGMAGVNIQPKGSSYEFYPEFGLMIHPIRLISNDPESFDFTLSTHISKQTRFGFGISLPIEYRNNLRW
jgi:hypothetical protein